MTRGMQVQNQLVATVVNEMRRAHSHLVSTHRRVVAFYWHRIASFPT